MTDTNPAIDRPDDERPQAEPMPEAAPSDDDAEDARTAPALRRRDGGGGDALS